MLKNCLILLFVLTWLVICHPAHAGTTAHGEVLSYNGSSARLILSIDSSDLRYHGISRDGGIVSVTVGNVTREAYLIPAELADDDLYQTARLLGYAPDPAEIPLALLVASAGSALQHFDPTLNPMQTFNAVIGDAVRVTPILPPPTPTQRDLSVEVFAISESGRLQLDLAPAAAAEMGLLPGISGTLYPGEIGDTAVSFLMIEQANYSAYLPPADLYLYAVHNPDEAAQSYLVAAPPPLDIFDVSARYGIPPGTTLRLTYPGFDYGQTSAGTVAAISADRQQITIDLDRAYLDQLGVQPGGYVLVSIDGILRAAMLMDDTLFSAAGQGFGRTSTYILHVPETGSLRLAYTRADGRTAQGIFEAAVGDRVRLRPARAIESIVREDVIVKTAAEIAPQGFIYTDVTPRELSFLEASAGQDVIIKINGIQYRAQVVDDDRLDAIEPGGVVLYIADDYLIITHAVGDVVTAEARFQVSVGDPIVIERAIN